MLNKTKIYAIHKLLFIFSLVALLIILPMVVSAEHYFHLEYVGYEQGLEDSSVEKIIQDSEGYIWFGTQDGLYKYDGRKAIKYSDDGKEGSLISDDIYDIVETKDKKLWIATATGGVAIYNRIIDKFKLIFDTSLPALKHYKSIALTEYKDSVFVIGGLGVERINKENYFVSSIPILNKSDKLLENYSARSLVVFEDKLLTLIDSQMYVYDNELSHFKPFYFESYREYSYISANEHYSLFSPSAEELYIYTTDGLFYVDSEHKNIIREPFLKNVKKEVRLLIRDIYKDSHNTIWIITRGHGAFYRDQNEKKYSSIRIGVGKNQLNSDQLYSIYEDKTNNIWIGTDGFYAAKFRAPRAAFPFFSNFYSQDRSYHTNTIWTFERFNGELYLGSDNGIFRITDSENEIEPFITTEKYRLTYDLLSTEKEMLIGGLNGLNSLLPTGETRNYNNLILKAMNMNASADNTVTQLAQSDSHLFVGTFNGVVAIEKNTEQTDYYNHENGDYRIHNGAIMSLTYDKKENLLWIGSETGVEVISMLFEKKAVVISEILKVIKGYVNDIHIDEQNHVWIAVDSTLYRFTPENALLKYEHFPENEIRAIETVENTLWMTTPTGMIKASMDNLEDFVYYIQEDGLYNTGNTTMSSMYLESSNELLFGGDKGFIKFDAAINIPVKEAIAPRMNIIRLTNASGQPDVLDRIQTTGSLEYFENSLRFEFAHLDFKAPKKTRFHYQLVGFDSDWSTLSNENIAAYTNLKSGDYVFRVKVYDANNVLSGKELSIHFTIKTAWWKSDVAYFLYFIGMLFGILFIVRWYKFEQARIKKLQIQNNKEEFISGYNRYALSLTELQSHQTLVRKFLDQLRLITGADCIHYKQFLMGSLLKISIGLPNPNSNTNSPDEIELTTKDTIAQLIIQNSTLQIRETLDADIQILFQQMVILQNALLDKQKYNWNDYFSSVTGLHNLKTFKNIMRDEIERSEINNNSLVFYEWSIDKGQFKENELLKRIQLLSYGDKLKDLFGAHLIATFSESIENIAKFVIFIADENPAKIQQYRLEFESLISEIAKNNSDVCFDLEDLVLVRLHTEFNNYIDTL